MRRIFAGPVPWHLLSLAVGTPIFAVGYAIWALASIRIALRGRVGGLFLVALPILLIAFDGLGIVATFFTLRQRMWTFGAPHMTRMVMGWTGVGWALVAAGQGLFLGVGGVVLWSLAPPVVDEPL